MINSKLREKKVELIFSVKITAEIKFEGEVNMYVAYVPALKIYSQGETQSEAELAIMDAVESYLTVSHKESGK